MNKSIHLFLLTILVTHLTSAQSTRELFSLPGYKMIIDIADDYGGSTRNDLYYVGDTFYNDTVYLQYKFNNFCDKYYLQIEDHKVFFKYYLKDERKMLFDFGVDIGDTTSLYYYDNFVVIDTSTVIFSDGLKRKKIFLESDNYPEKATLIEGVGVEDFGFFLYYNTTGVINCISSDTSMIYFNPEFTMEECELRSCPLPVSYFSYDGEDEHIEVNFCGFEQDSILMTFGDGIYFDHFVESYDYEEHDCYEIAISVTSDCGVSCSYSQLYDYCKDSLWQKKSNLKFSDIQFINENIGYAISSEHVYKTSNAGNDWDELELPTKGGEDIDNISIHFKDLDNGVIVTNAPNTSSYPEILYTSNGGLNWEGISNAKRNLCDAKISSSGNIFAFSNESIYKTSNQGNSWSKYSIPDGKYHRDVEISENDVITVAEIVKGEYSFVSHIYQSVDNGNNWNKIDMSFDFDIRSIYFCDENVGFASMRGELYKTVDGGESWKVVYDYRDDYSGTNISFSDLNHGVFQIGEAFYTTSDGGENWNVEFCSNDQYIRDIQSINGENYAALSSGFYKNEENPDFDCTEIVAADDTELEDIKIYPNPFVDNIYFEGKNATKYQLEIYNSTGQLVLSQDIQSEDNISTNRLKEGLYIALISNGIESKSFKLVKGF